MSSPAFHLALFGSPRAQESSFTSKIHLQVLEKKLTSHKAIKKIDIFTQDIAACTACNLCKQSTHIACSIKDSMSRIYPLIEEASSLSLSFPLYFSGLPSHVKALVDRCQPFYWTKKARTSMRPAAIVIAGGSSYNAMFEPSLRVLRHFFNTIGFHLDLEESILYENTDLEPVENTSYKAHG